MRVPDCVRFKRDGGNNKVHYYYNSHLGQPLKLFDKSGKTAWAARSQAFGETSVFVNETGNNLRLPGQYEDQESNLFYNFHRYYDPIAGRYLQVDPLGVLATTNFYGYASAMPIDMIDPLGLIVRYPGKDYRDRPSPGMSGCEKPIWAYGTIIGWEPCDEDCPDDQDSRDDPRHEKYDCPGDKSPATDYPNYQSFEQFHQNWMQNVVPRLREERKDRATECIYREFGLDTPALTAYEFVAPGRVGWASNRFATNSILKVVGGKAIPIYGQASTGLMILSAMGCDVGAYF